MAVFYILVILGIFCGDLWVKNRIEKAKSLPDTVLGGRILIRKYHNKGAGLNLGQKKSFWVAALSLALCFLMSVVFLLSLGRRGSRTLRLGLSLLLGGAFSNTYDRLKRKYVVDYFSFPVKWKPLRRVVFNLSDFCILIGAMLSVAGAR